MMTDYFDPAGNRLSHEDLRKVLRRNSHAQFNGWRAKQKQYTGDARPPRGVRVNKEISRL
jgi:hypothetical protein